MTDFVAKAVAVKAMQFDGTHACYLEIAKAFPTLDVSYRHEYSSPPKIKLLVRIGDKFHEVKRTDYLVLAPHDQVFIYPQLVFEAMYEQFFEEP